MQLVILTGASGAGKTTIAKKIAAEEPKVTCLFFDSIGVPSLEEMVRRYGSGEEWQRVTTIEWLTRIRRDCSGLLLFEGQARISFLEEGLREAGIEGATIVLVDCDDEERRHRLESCRGQPELANERMMAWARFLRKEAEERKIQIIHTGQNSLADSVNELKRVFGLQGRR